MNPFLLNSALMVAVMIITAVLIRSTLTNESKLPLNATLLVLAVATVCTLFYAVWMPLTGVAFRWEPMIVSVIFGLIVPWGLAASSRP